MCVGDGGRLARDENDLFARWISDLMFGIGLLSGSLFHTSAVSQAVRSITSGQTLVQLGDRVADGQNHHIKRKSAGSHSSTLFELFMEAPSANIFQWGGTIPQGVTVMRVAFH